ncbi:MAG: hypothetical protein JO000_21490 [Alphaproteobacteria bacterium]|nr:hypothetical protein [Alphaproteobacteria bacterium]
MMDLPPPAIYLHLAQAETAPQPEAPAPLDIPPTKVDVGRYVPLTAIEVTMIVTVTPPTGAALVYAPGYEQYATLFRGPKSGGDVRLTGPFVYVKLIEGATGFEIRYLRWREP